MMRGDGRRMVAVVQGQPDAGLHVTLTRKHLLDHFLSEEKRIVSEDRSYVPDRDQEMSPLQKIVSGGIYYEETQDVPTYLCNNINSGPTLEKAKRFFPTSEYNSVQTGTRNLKRSCVRSCGNESIRPTSIGKSPIDIFVNSLRKYPASGKDGTEVVQKLLEYTQKKRATTGTSPLRSAASSLRAKKSSVLSRSPSDSRACRRRKSSAVKQDPPNSPPAKSPSHRAVLENKKIIKYNTGSPYRKQRVEVYNYLKPNVEPKHIKNKAKIQREVMFFDNVKKSIREVLDQILVNDENAQNCPELQQRFLEHKISSCLNKNSLADFVRKSMNSAPSPPLMRQSPCYIERQEPSPGPSSEDICCHCENPIPCNCPQYLDENIKRIYIEAQIQRWIKQIPMSMNEPLSVRKRRYDVLLCLNNDLQQLVLDKQFELKAKTVIDDHVANIPMCSLIPHDQLCEFRQNIATNLFDRVKNIHYLHVVLNIIAKWVNSLTFVCDIKNPIPVDKDEKIEECLHILMPVIDKPDELRTEINNIVQNMSLSKSHSNLKQIADTLYYQLAVLVPSFKVADLEQTIFKWIDTTPELSDDLKNDDVMISELVHILQLAAKNDMRDKFVAKKIQNEISEWADAALDRKGEYFEPTAKRVAIEKLLIELSSVPKVQVSGTKTVLDADALRSTVNEWVREIPDFDNKMSTDSKEVVDLIENVGDLEAIGQTQALEDKIIDFFVDISKRGIYITPKTKKELINKLKDKLKQVPRVEEDNKRRALDGEEDNKRRTLDGEEDNKRRTLDGEEEIKGSIKSDVKNILQPYPIRQSYLDNLASEIATVLADHVMQKRGTNPTTTKQKLSSALNAANVKPADNETISEKLMDNVRKYSTPGGIALSSSPPWTPSEKNEVRNKIQDKVNDILKHYPLLSDRSAVANKVVDSLTKSAVEGKDFNDTKKDLTNILKKENLHDLSIENLTGELIDSAKQLKQEHEQNSKINNITDKYSNNQGPSQRRGNESNNTKNKLRNLVQDTLKDYPLLGQREPTTNVTVNKPSEPPIAQGIDDVKGKLTSIIKNANLHDVATEDIVDKLVGKALEFTKEKLSTARQSSDLKIATRNPVYDRQSSGTKYKGYTSDETRPGHDALETRGRGLGHRDNIDSTDKSKTSTGRQSSDLKNAIRNSVHEVLGNYPIPGDRERVTKGMTKGAAEHREPNRVKQEAGKVLVEESNDDDYSTFAPGASSSRYQSQRRPSADSFDPRRRKEMESSGTKSKGYTSDETRPGHAASETRGRGLGHLNNIDGSDNIEILSARQTSDVSYYGVRGNNPIQGDRERIMNDIIEVMTKGAAEHRDPNRVKEEVRKVLKYANLHDASIENIVEKLFENFEDFYDDGYSTFAPGASSSRYQSQRRPSADSFDPKHIMSSGTKSKGYTSDDTRSVYDGSETKGSDKSRIQRRLRKNAGGPYGSEQSSDDSTPGGKSSRPGPRSRSRGRISSKGGGIGTDRGRSKTPPSSRSASAKGKLGTDRGLAGKAKEFSPTVESDESSGTRSLYTPMESTSPDTSSAFNSKSSRKQPAASALKKTELFNEKTAKSEIMKFIKNNIGDIDPENYAEVENAAKDVAVELKKVYKISNPEERQKRTDEHAKEFTNNLPDEVKPTPQQVEKLKRTFKELTDKSFWEKKEEEQPKFVNSVAEKAVLDFISKELDGISPETLEELKDDVKKVVEELNEIYLNADDSEKDELVAGIVNEFLSKLSSDTNVTNEQRDKLTGVLKSLTNDDYWSRTAKTDKGDNDELYEKQLEEYKGKLEDTVENWAKDVMKELKIVDNPHINTKEIVQDIVDRQEYLTNSEVQTTPKAELENTRFTLYKHMNKEFDPKDMKEFLRKADLLVTKINAVPKPSRQTAASKTPTQLRTPSDQLRANIDDCLEELLSIANVTDGRDQMKEDIAKQLASKFNELNFNPEILKDDFLYRDLIEDEVDSLLADLPIPPQEYKNVDKLKKKLVNKIMDLRAKTLEALSVSEYRQHLRDCIDNNLLIENLCSESQTKFGILKENIVDAFICIRYFRFNPQLKEKFKRKICSDVLKFREDYEKCHPCYSSYYSGCPLSRHIYTALKYVPAPRDEALKKEVEYILTKELVMDWIRQISLNNDTHPDELKTNKMVSVLARTLHDLETEIRINHDLPIDEMRTAEINKWLSKFFNYIATEESDYATKLLVDALKATQCGRNMNCDLSSVSSYIHDICRSSSLKFCSSCKQTSPSLICPQAGSSRPSMPKACMFRNRLNQTSPNQPCTAQHNGPAKLNICDSGAPICPSQRVCQIPSGSLTGEEKAHLSRIAQRCSFRMNGDACLATESDPDVRESKPWSCRATCSTQSEQNTSGFEPTPSQTTQPGYTTDPWPPPPTPQENVCRAKRIRGRCNMCNLSESPPSEVGPGPRSCCRNWSASRTVQPGQLMGNANRCRRWRTCQKYLCGVENCPFPSFMYFKK